VAKTDDKARQKINKMGEMSITLSLFNEHHEVCLTCVDKGIEKQTYTHCKVCVSCTEGW